MAAELHPSPHAAFARGQLLQQQNRIDDAISCYKQALDIDGNHAPSFMMLALCWTENPDTTAQAVDAARRAIALEPEDAFARSVLALALNATAHGDHPRRQDRPPEALKHLWPDHEVRDPRLVLQCDEHDALGGSGPLPHEHDAGGFQPAPVARVHGGLAADDAPTAKILAQKRDRVVTER